MALPTPNPFRPGAGRVPPELAGRDALVSEVQTSLDEVVHEGEGGRPVIISGLRGVGKTVLLNEFVRTAQDSKRWIAIKLEAVAGNSLQLPLARAIHQELRSLMTTGEVAREKLMRALAAFKSFQVKVDPSGTYAFGFDVEPVPGIADTGDFQQDVFDLLDQLGRTARDLGMGVLLAIDELQSAPKSDLNALNVALHNLGQDPRPVPVSFIGTGLPSLPSVLSDATSYAERLYDYRTIGLLEDAEARDALAHPVERRGIVWEPAALDEALQSVGGYPYFTQACGKHVWDVSTGTTITRPDTLIGIQKARDEVDRGLYMSRWDRATQAQRAMMKAMAEDDDRPSAIQDLVIRLGKSRTSDLSVSRKELIKSGHIYAVDRGFVAFTVPGMADFIRRRIGDLESRIGD
ncbi:ATP-binding protein [Agromyces archimandritae]|uniref:ATP-binding protein n=1 Tax=Agromyces archimandritae TaxID=2781962 RepID=A0A975FNX9_9MICO|nr:ATP-binding protein [Agromyces archimandritae]QTX05604.1 ATP-binding protein [Agromyces archimandritae]